MKNIYLVLFLCSVSAYSTAQNDSIIIKKLNQIEQTIKVISQKPYNTKDSILISIDNLEKLSNSLEKRKKPINDILPSIIAILVVLISTGGAIYIGIRQIKIQTTNSEEQIRSQEAQAQDNLRVAREQIEETSKMTLAQVRANNISQARINWIQDLRSDLSQYNGEVAIINFYLQDVIDLNEKGERIKAEQLYNEQIERIKEARQFAFKIKLFLNKNEPDHMKLEHLIDKYYETALDNYETIKSNYNRISDDILDISRKILKDAWEQAKNEGT
ncbi:hypothetical protein [Maribellus sediminis]|uniref:hypothetical protein n=1 Tax=Maribellus sediminis TaxID=2696285 RepID=UPI0014306B31|nr:hypothetical protein [Maribellus sediminis]